MSFEHLSFLGLLAPLALYLSQTEHSLVQNLRWWALALLLLALSQPFIKGQPIEQEMPSHSLIIALDLSASMQAEDILPNRMSASKESIKAFLEANRANQIALLGFTINPLLLSPPTQDHALVAMALESIKSDYILTKGTNLRKLLQKVAQFSESQKLLILFSDGGDEPIDESLIAFAQEQEIKILAIGMATLQGATLQLKDGVSLQDEKGHLVVSKLNEDLKTLSIESGGDFIPFLSAKQASRAILDWVEGQEMEEIKHKQRNNKELFWIPTFLAVILLFISGTKFSLKLLALLVFLGVHAEAKVHVTREEWEQNRTTEHPKTESTTGGWMDGYYLHQAYGAYREGEYKEALEALREIERSTLESQLVLAHVYYKQEQYKKAKNILKALKTDKRSIKQQLFYELGNCEAQLGYYEKAKENYVHALQLGEDADALHNLEVVIFLKQKFNSGLGVSNASSPQASKNTEATEESSSKANSKQEKVGSSGGSGGKVGKQSSVKIVKSDRQSQSKREMSSKAYDIINKGYIKERQPW